MHNAKLIVHSSTQEIIRLLWKRKVHHPFTRTSHWSLSWARWVQSAFPQISSLKTSFMFSFHLRQGHPSALPSRLYNQNSVYTYRFPHLRYIYCPPHTPSFHQPSNIWRPVRVAVRSEAWVLADWLLGSWFRIPLKAWMFVRVFLCCVVLCCPV
jgi:hypothetical protein